MYGSSTIEVLMVGRDNFWVMPPGYAGERSISQVMPDSFSRRLPHLPLLPPFIEYLQQSQYGTIHHLKFTVRSQRNADALYLELADSIQHLSVRVAAGDIPIPKRGSSVLS